MNLRCSEVLRALKISFYLNSKKSTLLAYSAFNVLHSISISSQRFCTWLFMSVFITSIIFTFLCENIYLSMFNHQVIGIQTETFDDWFASFTFTSEALVFLKIPLSLVLTIISLICTKIPKYQNNYILSYFDDVSWSLWNKLNELAHCKWNRKSCS